MRERLRAVGGCVRAACEAARGPLTLVAKALMLGAVASGALAGARLIERYARTAQAFATTEIEVEGLSRLTRARVLDTAGLAIGRNVFEVSPEQAASRLRREPWVAKVEVERRLPGRYAVRVVERRAAAVVVLDRSYLASADAIVFKSVEPADPVDLPVVTGLDAVEADERRALLGDALALIRDYREAGLAGREPIGEIHVEPDDGLSLRVGADAAYVRLGGPPFCQKLYRLRRVLDRLDGEATRPAYVYLDNAKRPDRVTVRPR